MGDGVRDDAVGCDKDELAARDCRLDGVNVFGVAYGMIRLTARPVMFASTCVDVPSGQSVALSSPQNVLGRAAPMMKALFRALMTRAWIWGIDGANTLMV